MSIHTFPLISGRRLVITPCKFSAGHVRLEIHGVDRVIMGSVTLDGPTLAVVAQAMELEALAALSRDAKFQSTVDKFGTVDTEPQKEDFSESPYYSIAQLKPATDEAAKAYAETLDKIRTNEIFGGVAS